MEPEKSKMLENTQNYLRSRTPEQIEEDREFFKDKRSQGWNEISEDNLPPVGALDALDHGGAYHKLKDADGNEGYSWVGADTYMWWVTVGQPNNITHWYKET